MTTVHIGMPVRFADGWSGKVAYAGGGIIACIADGEKPNPHWCGDYRLTGPSSVVEVRDNTAQVRWGPTPLSR